MGDQKVGRYEVLHELGQGGMAIVYLARDPFMNRQVAIKVLPRQFTFDPQFRTRFKREAEAVATLEHPAIVPVYDYGEADEQPFIVMRYMPGGTLADRIGKPEARTGLVPILNRVAQALDEAHTRGIIHRDLKPSNILFDAWGEAYLSDFGIAKLAESSGTYSGSMMLGTPAYMSPEQARGERNVDGRADIYSLGVLLFEMLSGRKPYDADTPMGIAVKHVTEPVPSILAFKPDLPPEYERIIARAMAKEKEDRYQTAMDLARAVTSILSDAATVTPPLPPAPPEPTRVAISSEAVLAAAPAPPTQGPAAAPLTEAMPERVPAAATVAAVAVPTPVPVPAPTPVAAPPARRGPSRPLIAGMVAGVALLAVLAIGGGAIALTILNRGTPTPTLTVTVALTDTSLPPSLTAVVPTDTRAPTDSPEPTETDSPTDTAAPAASATLAATATATQPAPTAAITFAPTTQAPQGCAALPANQQADCFAQATAERAAELTQNAIDATAGVPSAEP